MGVVVKGDSRGRELGFPTANLELEEEPHMLTDGIYACWVRLNGELYKGAMHIGPRPTFVEADPAIEVYILDFEDRNLYGEQLWFQCVARLRDIEKFDTIRDLVNALERDCEQARTILR
jgi:riboflavin kinase/FMN adenylyltransferase